MCIYVYHLLRENTKCGWKDCVPGIPSGYWAYLSQLVIIYCVTTQCNFVGDYHFRGNCRHHLQDKLLPSRLNETTCIITQTTKILAIHFLPKPVKNKTNYSSTSSKHPSFSRPGNSSLLWNLKLLLCLAQPNTETQPLPVPAESNQIILWTKLSTDWCFINSLCINSYNPLCPKWQLCLVFLFHPHNGLTF